MYSVTVRDNMMIAHSLSGAVFGPAQRLHGATYVVEVSLQRKELDPNGIVIDIGRAGALLHNVLEPYAYRNLDDVAEFAGQNTTTEALAKAIFDKVATAIRDGALGGDAAQSLESIRVTLRENPDAWASFEGPLHG